jgi:hypothetical protein
MRWSEDNIKINIRKVDCEGVNRIQLAKDRGGPMVRFYELPGSIKAENILTCRVLWVMKWTNARLISQCSGPELPKTRKTQPAKRLRSIRFSFAENCPILHRNGSMCFRICINLHARVITWKPTSQWAIGCIKDIHFLSATLPQETGELREPPIKGQNFFISCMARIPIHSRDIMCHASQQCCLMFPRTAHSILF